MAKNTIRQTTLHGLTRAKAARRLAAIVREMKQAEAQEAENKRSGEEALFQGKELYAAGRYH